MPRVELTVTEVVREGVRVDNVAQQSSNATDDHYIEENNGDVWIEIENENVASQTVAIEPNPTITADGLTVDPLLLTVPAGQTWLFGPFRQSTFKQDASGMIHANPSVSTDLKIRVFKMARPSQA